MAIKNRLNRHSADSVFTLALFSVFAIIALLTAVAGAGAYKNTAASIEERYNSRTSLSYIANKIRANNESGKISIETRENIEVLCFTETINDAQYETLIYCLNGKIKELFRNTEADIALDLGVDICSAQRLDFALEQENSNYALLTVTVDDLQNNTNEIAMNIIL